MSNPLVSLYKLKLTLPGTFNCVVISLMFSLLEYKIPYKEGFVLGLTYISLQQNLANSVIFIDVLDIRE